ncbi:MAG: tetratricopeptide repeat protein [Saprospiraceae bacterium]
MKKLVPGLLFLFGAFNLASQDIYDYAHSHAYARYLLQSQQYTLAAEEYERLIFLRPDNDTLRADLLRVYRRGDTPQRGLDQWAKWQLSPRPKNRLLYHEYSKLLLRGGYPDKARTLLAESELFDSAEIRRTELYAYMLEQKWQNARNSYNAISINEKIPRRADINHLIKRGERAKMKKPWVATALSVPVPGLGKAYAGEWKDGIISLLFVGVNTWQAYRRFEREGVDTFWGWIHGGFALGFYTGNIYGAHKAARRHNLKKTKRLQHDTEALLFPVLD